MLNESRYTWSCFNFVTCCNHFFSLLYTCTISFHSAFLPSNSKCQVYLGFLVLSPLLNKLLHNFFNRCGGSDMKYIKLFKMLMACDVSVCVMFIDKFLVFRCSITTNKNDVKVNTLKHTDSVQHYSIKLFSTSVVNKEVCTWVFEWVKQTFMEKLYDAYCDIVSNVFILVIKIWSFGQAQNL